jgi:hypothetical protein
MISKFHQKSTKTMKSNELNQKNVVVRKNPGKLFFYRVSTLMEFSSDKTWWDFGPGSIFTH